MRPTDLSYCEFGIFLLFVVVFVRVVVFVIVFDVVWLLFLLLFFVIFFVFTFVSVVFVAVLGPLRCDLVITVERIMSKE